MSVSFRTVGYLLTWIGGLLALITFFFLPYFHDTLNSPSTGPWTGMQLANGLQDYQLFWLEPVVALVLLGVAGLALFLRAPGRQAGFILLGLSSLAALLVCLKFYAETQSSYASSTHDFATSHAASLQIGFWMYVIGIAVVALGGLLQVASPRRA